MGGIVATLFRRPPDPQYNLTTLLLPGNGTNGAQNNTFLDSSSNNFTITRNGNTTQGTFTPFSQTRWSGNFNTSTTYLTVTDTANLRFGSANFTIEAWVYRAASGAVQTIASKGASTPTGWVFQISAADKLVFTDTSTSITGATTLNANTWYYVAVVRAGTGASQTTLYVNGTSDATGTSGTTFNQTTNMLIGADRSTTNFANGYISNLRLSNTNRTISGTPTSALTADANTIFLALGINRFQYTDSGGTYTNIAVTGTPSVQAFSPFAPSGAYDSTVVGGSGYFDGAGDYLSVTSNSLNPSGVDYTVNFWMYPTSYPQATCIIFEIGTSASGDMQCAIFNTGKIRFQIGGSVGGEANITLNQWQYISCVKSGTNFTVYVNTVAGTTVALTPNSKTTMSIGAQSAGGSPFAGYLSGFTVVSGTATVPSSVPTAPPSPTSTTLCLSFTNAGITNATAKNDLETVGNAQISTTQSKWGSGSIAFDGTGDWLLIPHRAEQMLSTGAFTIEMWVYRNSSGTYGLVAKGTATTGWLVSLNTSNQVVFTYASSTITSTGTISATTWTHIAVVREGTGTNQTKIYISGTNDGTGTVATDFTQTNGMYVGANRTAGNAFNGNIDDLRISKIARYTANFTPPTTAFPVQ